MLQWFHDPELSLKLGEQGLSDMDGLSRRFLDGFVTKQMTPVEPIPFDNLRAVLQVPDSGVLSYHDAEDMSRDLSPHNEVGRLAISSPIRLEFRPSG